MVSNWQISKESIRSYVESFPMFILLKLVNHWSINIGINANDKNLNIYL